MIKRMIKEYNHIIRYLIFGVLTTLVNIISYFIVSRQLKLGITISTIIAWILAVLFAYFTNRKWVFNSYSKKKKDIIKELLLFFSCRLTTGFIDWLIMLIFAEKMRINDVIIKIISNVIVIILNYIASKILVFRKNNTKKTN